MTIILFYLSIFLLPFNGFPYFKGIFGELYVELSYYPLYFLIVFFIFYLIKNKQWLLIPKNKILIFLFLTFYIWIICSFLFNFNHISNNFFRGRTGFEKFFLQFILITFLYFVVISFYNILKNQDIDDVFNKIKKTVFYTFIFIFIWGIFEFLYKFTNLKPYFIKNLECLLSINCNGYGNRLKFFTGEPSYYGIYLTFAFPFFISYVLDIRKEIYKLLVFWVFIFFSYFTFSRTVWIIIQFQFFIFFVFMLVKSKFSGKTTFLLFIFILSVFTFNSKKDFLYKKRIWLQSVSIKETSLKDTFNEKSYYKISNNTRKTMQLIGYKIALESPIFGKGLGQYGSNFQKYITEKDLFNPELRENLNPSKKNVWPAAHGIFARLSAEIGFVGLFLWIIIWIYIFKKLYKIYRADKYNENLIVLLTIIPSLMLLGFSADSFRFLGYWYALALSIVFIEKFNYE